MLCSYGFESFSGDGFARGRNEEEDDEYAQNRSERKGQGIRLLETNSPHGTGHGCPVIAPVRRQVGRICENVRQHRLSRASRGHPDEVEAGSRCAARDTADRNKGQYRLSGKRLGDDLL